MPFRHTLGTQIGVLTALTLHERRLGVAPGQSDASRAAGAMEIKIGSYALEELVISRLSTPSLNHLTDLAWALDQDVKRNLKLRQYLYRNLPSMRGSLELRPPKTRHLPLSSQPATVHAALRELQHPALRSAPSWTPPAFNVTRQNLGVWPDPQGLGSDYLSRLSTAWSEAAGRAPQNAARQKTEVFWKDELLRDEHLTTLLLLSFSRLTDLPVIFLTPQAFARAAHVLTELTETALTQGPNPDDHQALGLNDVGKPQFRWEKRLAGPPSAWSLAAGLACSLRSQSPSKNPEWLHALMLADQALERLGTQVGATSTETFFGVPSVEFLGQVMISAINQIPTQEKQT